MFLESYIVGLVGEGVLSLDIFFNEFDVDIMVVVRLWFVFERYVLEKV